MNDDWLADTHHLTRHATANSEVGDEEVGSSITAAFAELITGR